MVTYGWTLDQTLDLTLPQANMLFKQMGTYPSPSVVLGAFLTGRETKAEDEIGKLAPHAAVENVEGGAAGFFAKLGIEPGGESD